FDTDCHPKFPFYYYVITFILYSSLYFVIKTPPKVRFSTLTFGGWYHVLIKRFGLFLTGKLYRHNGPHLFQDRLHVFLLQLVNQIRALEYVKSPRFLQQTG